MKIVQRGNKQLKIADEQLDNMLKAGYVEIDQKTGKVLTEKVDETKALKKENAALKKENSALKTENAELRAKVEALETVIQGGDPTPPAQQ